MSVKCPKCGCDELYLTTERADIFDYNWKCNNCGHIFERKVEPLPLYTLFDHLTESVETLAEKLVCEKAVKGNAPIYGDYGSTIGVRTVIRNVWRSALTDDTYKNRAEAIAATIEELKKGWNG